MTVNDYTNEMKVTKASKGDINTLYNVCAVPWGVLSTVGVFSTVGGYHEYRGGIS